MTETRTKPWRSRLIEIKEREERGCGKTSVVLIGCCCLTAESHSAVPECHPTHPCPAPDSNNPSCGALKVARVEQMAHFPQSLGINESLPQKKCKSPKRLIASLKRASEGGGRRVAGDDKRKGKFLTAAYSGGRLIKPCVCVNQFRRTFPPSLQEPVIGFGLSSGGRVCV